LVHFWKLVVELSWVEIHLSLLSGQLNTTCSAKTFERRASFACCILLFRRFRLLLLLFRLLLSFLYKPLIFFFNFTTLFIFLIFLLLNLPLNLFLLLLNPHLLPHILLLPFPFFFLLPLFLLLNLSLKVAHKLVLFRNSLILLMILKSSKLHPSFLVLVIVIMSFPVFNSTSSS